MAKQTKQSKQSKEAKDVAMVPRSWFMEPWREMDRMFEDFFDRRMRGLPSLLSREERVGSLTPSIDVKEDDKSIVVTAELPGLDEDDVEVTFRDGVLTLKGEKRLEAEKKEDNFHITERRYGSFQRSFTVPETVDEAKIEATFDKGVLTVNMAKRAAAAKAAKKIKVGTKAQAKPAKTRAKPAQPPA